MKKSSILIIVICIGVVIPSAIFAMIELHPDRELQKSCEAYGLYWLSNTRECYLASPEICSALDGTYDECGPPRFPDGSFGYTLDCNPTCRFE